MSLCILFGALESSSLKLRSANPLELGKLPAILLRLQDHILIASRFPLPITLDGGTLGRGLLSMNML